MLLRSYMPVSRYQGDPIDVLRSVTRGLDDVWSLSSRNSSSGSNGLSVRLDVKEDGNAYHVTAELPGLSDKDIETTFDDGVLTIRGEKKVDRSEKSDIWHVTERSQGTFERQMSLPTSVDAEKIDAVFDKGVLKIRLPKVPVEAPTAKKIVIKSA